MKNWGVKQWMTFTSVSAFASAISFFQIDSYWSDQNNFNGVFGWLGIGIVFGVLAIAGLYKAYKAQKD